MTSNGKQFSVTRQIVTAVARDQRWPHVVARILARFSKFAFVLFCYITNYLMTGSLGNNKFCFPRIPMFPSTSSRETSRFSGNKIHCSPRDQSLSVKCSPQDQSALCKPRTTSFGLSSFSYFSAKQWNALPHCIRTSDFTEFKRNIQGMTFV